MPLTKEPSCPQSHQGAAKFYLSEIRFCCTIASGAVDADDFGNVSHCGGKFFQPQGLVLSDFRPYVSNAPRQSRPEMLWP